MPVEITTLMPLNSSITMLVGGSILGALAAYNTMQTDAATKLDTPFRSAIKARANMTPKLG
jgi:hypothetical protein